MVHEYAYKLMNTLVNWLIMLLLKGTGKGITLR